MPNTHSTLTALFSDIADAIRSKAGSSAPIVADAFPSAIAAIPSGGGGDEIWPKIVDRSISQFADTSGAVSKIGDYAFARCRYLTTVNFPSASTIGNYAFYNCERLSSVNFPSASSIDVAAFALCYVLTDVNCPSVTTIGPSAFSGCQRLSTISFPNATVISIAAFQSTALQNIDLPSATTVMGYAFRYCSSLETVTLSKLEILNNYMFDGCISLHTASFPAATSIGNGVFAGCSNLVSLYLLGSSFCSLISKGAFTSTPIGGYSDVAGQYGSVYVRASLYSLYLKTGQAWWNFSSRIVSVEDGA